VSGRHLLFDFALQTHGGGGELGGAGLDQPGVEAAIVLDRAQAGRRHAQAHGAAQHVGDERDIVQVRQELALGLDLERSEILFERSLRRVNGCTLRCNRGLAWQVSLGFSLGLPFLGVLALILLVLLVRVPIRWWRRPAERPSSRRSPGTPGVPTSSLSDSDRSTPGRQVPAAHRIHV